MNIVEYTAAAAVILGSVTGAFTFAENRYASAAEVDDLVHIGLKRELREVRRERDRGEATDEDVEIVLDILCRRFPQDRECLITN